MQKNPKVNVAYSPYHLAAIHRAIFSSQAQSYAVNAQVSRWYKLISMMAEYAKSGCSVSMMWALLLSASNTLLLFTASLWALALVLFFSCEKSIFKF
jgi:hypothetical protein